MFGCVYLLGGEYMPEWLLAIIFILYVLITLILTVFVGKFMYKVTKKIVISLFGERVFKIIVAFFIVAIINAILLILNAVYMHYFK